VAQLPALKIKEDNGGQPGQLGQPGLSTPSSISLRGIDQAIGYL